MDPDDMIIDDAPLVLPNDSMDDVEDGEVNPTDICPNKVYIAGLNEQVFNQNVLDYIKTHYPSDEFEKIEWINDYSVNIVYNTDTAAAEALEAFSTTSHSDPLQLRPARAISTLPEIELTARLATVTDVKKAGAAAASRFYLRNPDEDPTNRPRHKRRPHSTRGPVDRSDLHRYRSRDYTDKTTSGLNYDDDDNDDEPGPSHRNLIDTRPQPRLRDRSASPTREGDGRNGFPATQPYRRTARARSRPPRRGRDNLGAARELLATDLFSRENRSLPAAQKPPQNDPRAPPSRELFPDKTSHRRQDAQHLSSADVAQAFGNYRLSSPEREGGDGGGGGGGGGWGEQAGPREPFPPPSRQTSRAAPAAPQRDLFSRIGAGNRSDPAYGRLNPGDSTLADGGLAGERGFRIRGKGEADRGFSILGASRDGAGARARELYPQKIREREGREAGRGRGRRVRVEELM